MHTHTLVFGACHSVLRACVQCAFLSCPSAKLNCRCKLRVFQARSPVVSPQYERKWASSSLSWSSTTRSGDLRASSSLGLRSATRPASAKGTTALFWKANCAVGLWTENTLYHPKQSCLQCTGVSVSVVVTRPSSALSRSLVSGGDVGSNKGKLRPQSAASKPR